MSALRVVALFGPTAVGKTDLSIRVARQIGAEIVSVDSRLLYRGMDIGTAKPTLQQREQVRHHLIDVAAPDEAWSLARFQSAAKAAIEDIHRRGRLPFLVGGTGQYMSGLLEGWVPPPVVPGRVRNQVRLRAEREGGEALYAELQQVDPEAAARIDPRNLRRVLRALEVFQATGIPSRERPRRREPGLEALKIGLRRPREELYVRIDERIDAMLASGWLDEVRSLLESGYTRDLPSMSAIGYAQLAAYLEGEMSYEEAVREMRRLSRQFVRRQSNWFKRLGEGATWFEMRPGVDEQVRRLIEEWLESGG